MTSFMELLKSRRSIRKFTDEPVTEAELQTLYEAVQWSQSWANTQCWEVVNVTDASLRTRLQETMGKGNPATAAIVNAPVLLAICAKLKASGHYNGQAPTIHGDWYLFDLGIAVQSLCLAAADLGLGTVVVGLYKQEAAAEILGLPEGMTQVALIPLGRPAQSPKPPKRKEISEFVHQDRIGS